MKTSFWPEVNCVFCFKKLFTVAKTGISGLPFLSRQKVEESGKLSTY